MTAGPADEPTAAIEYSEVTDSRCGSCGHPLSALASDIELSGPLTAVRIVNITQVKAGWLARGKIPAAQCDICGRT
jgi:uncharacterized OB-fold protein